jgi:uncharacterized protein YdaU (DUF1376 family)
MAKDPAFLFYPGDWLSGTMGMSYEEKGAYLELLIFQFNNGKFTTKQAKQVLSICSTSVFENVVQKFSTDGTYFWKQRLYDEVYRRKKFTDSRRNNALGGNKANKKEKKTSKAYAKHMETEAITETETITKAETKLQEVEFYLRENASKLYHYPEAVTLGAPKIAAAFFNLLGRRQAEGNPIEQWKPYLFKWLAGHGNLDEFQPKEGEPGYVNKMVEFFKNE